MHVAQRSQTRCISFREAFVQNEAAHCCSRAACLWPTIFYLRSHFSPEEWKGEPFPAGPQSWDWLGGVWCPWVAQLRQAESCLYQCYKPLAGLPEVGVAHVWWVTLCWVTTVNNAAADHKHYTDSLPVFQEDHQLIVDGPSGRSHCSLRFHRRPWRRFPAVFAPGHQHEKDLHHRGSSHEEEVSVHSDKAASGEDLTQTCIFSSIVEEVYGADFSSSAKITCSIDMYSIILAQTSFCYFSCKLYVVWETRNIWWVHPQRTSTSFLSCYRFSHSDLTAWRLWRASAVR